MLQVKNKVILGIKYLQTAYISHHGVDFLDHSCSKDVIIVTQSLLWSDSSEYESDIRSLYKCHFSNTSTCAPYRQVPVEVYRGGPSLYGNWPTYIFAARENVNVSLFLPYITCYFFVAYVQVISINTW